MKRLFAVNGLILAGFLSHAAAQTNAAPAVAAPEPATATASTAAPVPARPMIFHPPGGVSGGILPIRVGGGSRGDKAGMPTVAALVPDQVALTTQAQPSLYYYQDKPAKTQFEVSVTEPKNPHPLMMLKSGAETPAGIHAVRLSKFNVKLKPGVTYKWSVAIVVDPANRSQDIVANGAIKRIDPSPDLAAKLAAASDADKPSIFAENGIWYDALQGVSDQIDKSPKDAALRQERLDLINQIDPKHEMTVTDVVSTGSP